LFFGVIFSFRWNVVLGKQIFVLGHGFEFQIVPGRILEEHGVLLSRFALKPQVGLDDKVHVVGAQPINQVLELFDGFQCQTGVGDGHFVPIHGVVVIDTSVVVSGPVADDLMTVERIILPLFGGPALFATQNGPIELFGRLERMNGESVVEGISGGRSTSCFVLR